MRTLAIILVLVISGGVFAQDCLCFKTDIDMKQKLGMFLFANSDFTPGNFIGGVVGAKYFVSSRLAVRGGFSIKNTMFNAGPPPRFGGPRYDPFPDPMAHDHMHNGNVYSTFGANAYAMYYPVRLGSLMLYGGGGVVYDFYTTHQSITVNGTTIENDRSQHFGFGGIVGTELSVSKKMNLSFEYNPIFLLENNTHHREDQSSGNPPLPPPHGFDNVSASNFNLGLTYFFR